MYTKRYLQDLTVRMAHHSTAIEGNTLTLGDTKTILIDNIVPRTAKLREIYEVDNYRRLLPYLIDHAIKYPDKKISLQTIKEINGILMNNIDNRGGNFKDAENMVLGAPFIPTHPSQVPSALLQWCDNLQYRLETAVHPDEKTEILMDQHLKFEHIHPFADGNGRTGRALIVYSCLQQKLTPIVIEKEQRDEYILLMNNEDVPGLTQMALTLQKKELTRKKGFDQENRQNGNLGIER